MEGVSSYAYARNDGNVWKGLVAGLAGGLVASWTMNQFQAAWTRMARNSEKPHGAQSMQPSQGSTGNQAEDAKEQDDATVETAKVISKNVFGHELQESEKEIGGRCCTLRVWNGHRRLVWSACGSHSASDDRRRHSIWRRVLVARR